MVLGIALSLSTDKLLLQLLFSAQRLMFLRSFFLLRLRTSLVHAHVIFTLLQLIFWRLVIRLIQLDLVFRPSYFGLLPLINDCHELDVE